MPLANESEKPVHPDDVPRWWRPRKVWIIFVLLQPLNYVLTLGPAVRLHQISPRPVKKVIETVYAPLEYLDRHDNLPGKRLLDAYIDLWRP